MWINKKTKKLAVGAMHLLIALVGLVSDLSQMRWPPRFSHLLPLNPPLLKSFALQACLLPSLRHRFGVPQPEGGLAGKGP